MSISARLRQAEVGFAASARLLGTVRDIVVKNAPNIFSIVSFSLDDTIPRELRHLVIAHSVPFQADIFVRGEYPVAFVRATVENCVSITSFELFHHQ